MAGADQKISVPVLAWLAHRSAYGAASLRLLLKLMSGKRYLPMVPMASYWNVFFYTRAEHRGLHDLFSLWRQNPGWSPGWWSLCWALWPELQLLPFGHHRTAEALKKSQIVSTGTGVRDGNCADGQNTERLD